MYKIGHSRMVSFGKLALRLNVADSPINIHSTTGDFEQECHSPSRSRPPKDPKSALKVLLAASRSRFLPPIPTGQ